MELQERVSGIIAALKDAYPDPVCALQYKKDYELMIAVRLSAQCTDERVNKSRPRFLRASRPSTRLPMRYRGGQRTMSVPAGFTSTRRATSFWHASCCAKNMAARFPARWKRSFLFPVLAEKLRIYCWVIFTKLPARSSATRTASASQTFWGSPRARTRQRSKRSCARFCRRRNRLISATGWCCTEEPSASPAARSAAAAASRPTAEAFQGSERA